MDGEPSLQFESRGGAVPADIVLAPGQKVQLSSVVARWDGTGASGTFKPCLSIYSQDGVLVSRTFPGTDMAPGDSGVVTYAPFLGDEATTAGAAYPFQLDYAFAYAQSLTIVDTVLTDVNPLWDASGSGGTNNYLQVLSPGAGFEIHALQPCKLEIELTVDWALAAVFQRRISLELPGVTFGAVEWDEYGEAPLERRQSLNVHVWAGAGPQKITPRVVQYSGGDLSNVDCELLVSVLGL